VSKRSAVETQPAIASEAHSQADALSVETQEQVRCRAYELYELRGRVDGFAEEDWRQAEQEVLAGRANHVAA